MDHCHTKNGVYTINPDGTNPFQAYCDMSNGGWTVFQRRINDSVDFYRNWDEYVAGFGDLSGNLWAGLEKVHAMTAADDTELLVYMESFESESAYAQYSSFSVGDASSGYKMTVSGYSGTAGDAMARHNNMKFSTYDRDQDLRSGNCAESFGDGSGWWWETCFDANPNGPYLQDHTDLYGKSIIWSTWKGFYYSLKTIELKVRRL